MNKRNIWWVRWIFFCSVHFYRVAMTIAVKTFVQPQCALDFLCKIKIISSHNLIVFHSSICSAASDIIESRVYTFQFQQHKRSRWIAKSVTSHTKQHQYTDRDIEWKKHNWVEFKKKIYRYIFSYLLYSYERTLQEGER